MNNIFQIAAVCGSALLLTGGGGGSSSTSASAPSYADLTDTTAGTTSVSTVTLAGTGPTATVGSGTSTYTHATQQFTVGANIVIADTAGLTAGLDHVASVAAGSQTAAGDTRLIAVATQASDMPTTAGTLTYNGSAIARVNDGTNTYDATMDATITANINAGGGGTVDVALSNVAAGAQQTAAGGAVSAYTAGGAEAVTLTGATISGNGFSGGTSATISDWNGAGAGNTIVGAQTVNSEGVFAGAQADEVAGTAVASGATSGWYNMTFVGD